MRLFLPVLACCDHEFVLFWSAEQFYDHIIQEPVNSAKSSNNGMSRYGLIEQNLELYHIYQAVSK